MSFIREKYSWEIHSMTQLMFMGNIILNMITLILTKSIQKDITELVA